MVHLFMGPEEITYILLNASWTMKSKMHTGKTKKNEQTNKKFKHEELHCIFLLLSRSPKKLTERFSLNIDDTMKPIGIQQ